VKNHALILEAAAPPIMTIWHVRHGPESRSTGSSSLPSGSCSRLTRANLSAGPGVLLVSSFWRRVTGESTTLLFVSGQPRAVPSGVTGLVNRCVTFGGSHSILAV
jgi:hypothetical protein